MQILILAWYNQFCAEKFDRCYVKKILIIKVWGEVGSELSEVNDEKNITRKEQDDS